MKCSHYAICVASLLSVLTSRSAQAAPCDVPRATTVVFSNGMLSTDIEAMAAIEGLATLLEQTQPSTATDTWRFEIAYNATTPALEQLLETAQEQLGGELAVFWRMLGGGEESDWFKETVRDIATELQRTPPHDDAELMKHVARYQQLLASGSQVVVVAHAQANLVANAAYAALFERGEALVPPALGIVSVASTADRVAGMGPHTTLEEDLVVAAVRAAFPSTLPANVSASSATIDPLGHDFSSAYLRATQSREQIGSNVLSTAAALPVPESANGVLNAADESACSDADSEQGALACEPSGWSGTCAATFLEPCWDGEGACEIDVTSVPEGIHSTVVFENGARNTILQDVDWENLSETRARTSYRSSTGVECATGEIWILLDEPTCIASATFTSAAGQLSYCMDESGVLRGICPDGSSFSIITSPECGRTGMSCLVDADEP
jgi:hypothetical protein